MCHVQCVSRAPLTETECYKLLLDQESKRARAAMSSYVDRNAEAIALAAAATVATMAGGLTSGHGSGAFLARSPAARLEAAAAAAAATEDPASAAAGLALTAAPLVASAVAGTRHSCAQRWKAQDNDVSPVIEGD